MKTLHVQFAGGKGLPLVMFHGWGFDSRVWQPILPTLKQFCAIYLVDLPGFGLSDLMDWVEFESALLKQLPAQFAVLGWSMGGEYAIQLAHVHPYRVTHLVGVGTSPKVICEKDWPGVDTAVFDSFMQQFSIDPAKTLQNFVLTQTGKQIKIDLARLPGIPALEAGLHLLKTWDLRSNLGEINKACFMFGRLDAIIPVKTLAVMKTQFPKFEYVLFKKSAHMPFISDTSLFMTELKRVLGE